ncbi:MAG: beta-glucosidase family protein [Bacteroidales bacterium]
MNKNDFKIIWLAVTAMFLVSACCRKNPDKPHRLAYAERMKREASTDRNIEKRVRELLSQMTLEEKVGQMMHLQYIPDMPTVYPENYPQIDTQRIIMYAKKNVGTFIDDVGITQEKWYNFINGLQRIYLENNRLKIPFLWSACHQHGAGYVVNSTIFPHNLTLAATFNTEFAHQMGLITVYESADLGHNFIYVPVVDVGRNQRWSRFYETFGESSYLCARMGEAIVKGIQDTSIASPYRAAACAKHFIGYSDPRSGWDRTPATIADQELYEYYVPPFKACIDAGVKIIEANSSEVNGIPVHASYRLLTTLLRDELGFKGVLNSDWEDIRKLATVHKVAENEKEAAYLGVEAGIDLFLTPYDTKFGDDVIQLVREGRISEDRIDLSVARILRLKLELGLFEHPYPRNDRFDRLATPASSEMALNAARESIVLLKNEGNLLPLNKKKRLNLIVTGFNANKRMATSGGWTNRWSPLGDNVFTDKAQTLVEGISHEFAGSSVVFEKNPYSTKNVRNCDAIIYVAGEDPYAEGTGLINDMVLPENQLNEIKSAISTGIPVILVLVSGRPRIISDVWDDCKAVLWAGLPGYFGAKAIGEILAGKVNPSGKLPFSYPYTASRNLTYNHKNSERALIMETQLPWTIADFGSGLSYTTFRYDSLHVSDTIISGRHNEITAEVTVTNTGSVTGKEAVLWFIRDECGTITRPVRELKYFEKQEIKPGESKKFIFKINPLRDLSYPDEKGNAILEEGYFTLTVGDKSVRFKYQNK